MSNGLSSLLFVLALAFVIASVVRIRVRNRKNASIRQTFVDQEVLLELPVLTRAVHLWKFNALTLKGVIRVEMTLRSNSLQLVRPKPMGKAMLYKELIFSIATSEFAMGRLRFPFKKRDCIIVSGDEFGTAMKQAVYSKDHMSEILDALQRAGVTVGLSER